VDDLPSPKQTFWSSFSKFLHLDRSNRSKNSLKNRFSSNGSEIIDEEKRDQMLHSILDFRDTVVKEVMVPRIDIVKAEKSATVEELMDLIASQGHSRIPIYDETIDNIIGVVYAKDILLHLREGTKQEHVGALIRKPYFIPESKKIYSLLKEFQKNKVHIAIVVDEYGGTAGIVTMEDVLEEIVGEIQDEYDTEQPLYEVIDDHTVIMDAKMNIDEANELLNLRLPNEEDFETVGGLVFDKLGRVPVKGEEILLDDVVITIEKLNGHRIEKVSLTKILENETIIADTE
jgi:CBS domain containing-hemolysin-like protein